MKINISDLKNLTEILLDNIKESGRDYVDIPHDFYWFINKEKVYDPYNEPDLSECTLSQLSSDWENLQSILNNKTEPIGYALVWLSSLMRSIGEEPL